MTEPSTDWLSLLADHDVPCPRCGYNLRGASEPKCPECGEAFTLASVFESARRKRVGGGYWPGIITLVALVVNLIESLQYWYTLLRYGHLEYGNVSVEGLSLQKFASQAYWLSQAPALILLVLFRERFQRLPLWSRIVVSVLVCACSVLAQRRRLWFVPFLDLLPS